MYVYTYTHITHEYKHATQYELIYSVFGRKHFGKISANLDLLLRRFNEVQYWVVSEICLTSNLNKRVLLLRKFIKIAAQLVYYSINCYLVVI